MPIEYKEMTQKPQDREVDCDRFEHASSYWMDLIHLLWDGEAKRANRPSIAESHPRIV